MPKLTAGQPAEPARQIPAPVAQGGHGGRQQDPADHSGSISTAAASPTPSIFSWISESVARMAKTATMITPALVTIPGTGGDAAHHGVPGGRAAGAQLADPAQDKHLVVHAQPEQENENEQGYPGHDRPRSR